MLSHKGTQNIDTPRLCLRKYRKEDIEDIFRNYATDERVTKFLSWQPYADIAQLEGFVLAQIAGYNERVYHWVIEYNGQAIGSISVIREDENNASCEIGYCIGYDYWNKGIVTEAMGAVIAFLFLKVGYYRIFAKHDVNNPASGKVMQKCAMVYEGTLRQHYLRHDGTRADAHLYSILKDEFVPDKG